MNPRHLIDQTTGRVLPAQVRQAAQARAEFLAANGHDYRKALAGALRNARKLASSERAMWKMLNADKPVAMPYTGGRSVDGVANERVL